MGTTFRKLFGEEQIYFEKIGSSEILSTWTRRKKRYEKNFQSRARKVSSRSKKVSNIVTVEDVLKVASVLLNEVARLRPSNLRYKIGEYDILGCTIYTGCSTCNVTLSPDWVDPPYSNKGRVRIQVDFGSIKVKPGQNQERIMVQEIFNRLGV